MTWETAARRAPCPFCGSEEYSYVYLRGAETVGCDVCLTAREPWELPPDQEEDAWNWTGKR